jgi:hypothetical protein
MIPRIAGRTAFLLGLFVVMMFAQGPTDVVLTDSLSPFTRAQSGHQYAGIETVSGVSGKFPVSALPLLQTNSCSDPIDKCNDPVRYLGADGDCACFACEAGRPSEHNVCTQIQADKDKLLKRAKR